MTTDDYILDDGAGLGLSRGETLSAGAAAAIARAARFGKYYLYALLAYLAISLLTPLLGIGATAEAFEEAGDGLGGQDRAAMLGGLIFVYAMILALYLYPTIMFWGFTHKTPAGLAADAQATVVEGLDNLRSTVKYIGVFTLVVLAFYAVAAALIVAVGLAQ